MRFYNATSLVFPRNYPARMFALSFGAVHVPLITFLVLEAVRGQWHWGIFAALLVATVVGSALAIIGLWGLLAPIDVATKVLRDLHDGRVSSDIPVGGRDLAGDLLEATAHAVRSTAERVDALSELASTDLLTGLLNRRGFIEALGEAGGTGTLVILDGDGFKGINDTLGHKEGDRVLRMMGDLIRRNVRPMDLVARWGGDEFVIFFAELGEVDARRVVERMRNAMRRRPLSIVGNRPVSFSYGMTQVVECSRDDVEEVVSRADAGLYAEKRKPASEPA